MRVYHLIRLTKRFFSEEDERDNFYSIQMDSIGIYDTNEKACRAHVAEEDRRGIHLGEQYHILDEEIDFLDRSDVNDIEAMRVVEAENQDLRYTVNVLDGTIRAASNILNAVQERKK